MNTSPGLTRPKVVSPTEAAKGVLKATLAACETLQAELDLALIEDWTRHLVASPGRLVLCGMGKSGLIAQKIAATFASTGCPSLFLHPAEALHGDIGMVTADDTVMLLSNSGETEEITKLIPILLRLGVPMAAITSRRDSRLGEAVKWCFTYRLPDGEGCPLQFAPMASTTLQLVWGDLLAAYRMVSAGFTLEHYAEFHPAGNIGARLLKTKSLMQTEFPTVTPQSGFLEVLGAMTRGKLGMTTVLQGEHLEGVVSDGDIRRAVERAQNSGVNPLTLTAREILTPKPVQVPGELLAIEAARILEARKITFLVVTNPNGQVEGVLHIHHLLQAKVL